MSRESVEEWDGLKDLVLKRGEEREEEEVLECGWGIERKQLASIVVLLYTYFFVPGLMSMPLAH